MGFEVRLPDIGEGVAEGEIVRWLVKAGDAVREDQPLVEVMTDKANVEIPSPRTGTIEAIHAEEGQVILVGALMVTIAVAGAVGPSAGGAGSGAAGGAAGSPSSRGPVAPAPAPLVGGPAAPPAASSTTVQATPAVRQLARDLGVALEAVAGTGSGGLITAEDVRAAGGKGVPVGASASKVAPAGAEERLPVRGLRRLIAESMRRSLDTAAHFTFVAECDMSGVSEHMRATRARGDQAGVPLTYLAYVVKALVEPLQRFPLLNASLDDQAHEIVLKRYYHVGIATATPEGLTVPVVRDVDRRPLLGIAAEIRRLAEGARGGALKLEDLQGGTFTVTSTGAHGGLLATPIVHHPQVAILGVHEVKKRPVVVEDQVVARMTTNLSLSLDHRVVDGAVGADFLYAVIARLADPGAWLGPEELG